MHKTTDPEGRFWILQSSIEYPKAPTDETVAVRGTLIVGAFIFEPHRIILLLLQTLLALVTPYRKWLQIHSDHSHESQWRYTRLGCQCFSWTNGEYGGYH
eukprot:TRINITY_DN753_c0_g2_i12.p1 TRINITY_DN753_c0_g2~~TRINITY_DN753_c0_g2_i12.p1  ORF type:complete len:100 (+),score=2.73 TRINITY_DN753_c0_g2_i12:405-704(+)